MRRESVEKPSLEVAPTTLWLVLLTVSNAGLFSSSSDLAFSASVFHFQPKITFSSSHLELWPMT